MGGIDFLKELRADDDLCGSVVFILTTSSDDQDKMLAYKKNVAGYIVKKQVGESFLNIVDMLGHYWRVVELPYNE
jgi:DNA-binding NarL/FixJ family response regulator